MNRILRARIPGQRLVLAPEERSRLLAIGRELNHHVKGLVGVVRYRTYRRWVKEQADGRAAPQPRQRWRGGFNVGVQSTGSKRYAGWPRGAAFHDIDRFGELRFVGTAGGHGEETGSQRGTVEHR